MSTGIDFSTVSSRPGYRITDWAHACDRTYFPLEPSYRRPELFSGTLRSWSLGQVVASRYSADAALYERNAHHLRVGGDDEFLLTFPQAGKVRFMQRGREVVCAPGGFILERSNEPYEFSHDMAAELFVAKIKARDLQATLSYPERYCAVCFDSDYGVGGLLRDVIQLSEIRATELTIEGSSLLGQQVIELLSLAVQSHPNGSTSTESSVRLAHLQRINATITRRYSDPDLGPAEVAAACGISLRYLHDLCRGDGASFRERLRKTRLAVVQKALKSSSLRTSITEIALRAGFSDLSSFSRAYRHAFGETPRETRAQARPASKAHR